MPRHVIYGSLIYFVTTITKDRRQIFRDREQAGSLAQIIQAACQINAFTVLAYAILPDHLHLLVTNYGLGTLEKVPSGEPKNISNLMQSIKGNFSWQQWPGPIWQRRYHVRVIDDEDGLEHVAQYIANNYRKNDLPSYFGRQPYLFVNWRFLANMIG